MIEIMENGSDRENAYEWRNLPKNVRQIGETRERRKIYIEDYVVTYLRRLAKPSQAYARGAILFGNVCETEEGPAIFISGAVEAQNLELDMDETIFNEEIWAEIQEKGRKHFPGQEILGWFLSRMGFSVDMNQKIISTHTKNFPGDQKVLFMIDSLEKEDAMYLWDNGQMRRQKGYYIYYEKNKAMQEYMIGEEGNGKRSSEEEQKKTEIRRDRKVVNGYRKMSHYSRQNRNQNMKIRVTRAACLMLIFVMGIYIVGQLNQRSGGRLGNQAIETFQSLSNAWGEEDARVEEETRTGENPAGDKEGNLPENETENRVTEETGTEEDALSTEASSAVGPLVSTEKEIQETTAEQKPLYYTVEKGDTLFSISRKMYSTEKYAKRIAEANNMTNVDEIYEGQKILIPSVE